jgi:hypothetical protein
MTDHDLHLYEEILLLALNDEQGTVVSGAWYSQALAGALLAELSLLGRIRLGEGGERVRVADRTRVGEPLLDECLDTIARSKKPRKLRDWMTRVSNSSGLKHRAAESLCRRGILRADRDKVLLIFERRIYPERDGAPERALVERLRRAIFGSATDVAPRTVVVLSLAYRTDILKAVFDRKDLKRRKRRIEQVIEGDATGEVAAEVLAAIQMAVITSAAIVPIISS